MLSERLKELILNSLRQSYQDGDDLYEMKRRALEAALAYGQEYAFLQNPLTREEIAAVSVAVETVIRQTPPDTMIAILKLEFIGENYFMYKAYKEQGRVTTPSAGTERYGEFLGRDKSRPWVAQITGFDPKFGFARKFAKGHIDYTQASSNGSRGVWLFFHLKSGMYEVNERTSWRNVRRYFVRVEGTTITEISQGEVERWIKEGTV